MLDVQNWYLGFWCNDPIWRSMTALWWIYMSIAVLFLFLSLLWRFQTVIICSSCWASTSPKCRLMLEKCSGISHNSVSKDLVCFCSCIRWSMFQIPCFTAAWLLSCWARALSNTNHHPFTQNCYPTPKIRPTMTCPLQPISLDWWVWVEKRSLTLMNNTISDSCTQNFFLNIATITKPLNMETSHHIHPTIVCCYKTFLQPWNLCSDCLQTRYTLPLELSFVHVLGLNCFSKFCFQKNCFIQIFIHCSMIRLLFLQTFITIFIYPNQCTFLLILSYHHMHPLHITIWICLSKMRYLFLEIRSCILSYPMHNHFLIASNCPSADVARSKRQRACYLNT